MLFVCGNFQARSQGGNLAISPPENFKNMFSC